MREEQMRAKFDRWYASPRGEAQFTLGMHYLGWAYVCYAEGYKQAAMDMVSPFIAVATEEHFKLP